MFTWPNLQYSLNLIVGDLIDKNYDIITFVLNTFILRRPSVASFSDIIKLQPGLSKEPLKTSKKVKELEIVY